MMTYQIRKRIYRIDDPNGLKFPNEVEISFEMRPLQAFGMEPGNGRTAVQSVAAHATFDANTGWHTIESRQPLKPLDVTIEESDVRKVEIRGNMLKVTAPANSLEDLNDLLQSIFIGYPILLSIEFGDPVVITRVDGKVGGTPFRWELTDWRMEFDITTQKHQERKAADSWFRFNVISEPTRRRLMAALHYFHVAIRLARVGISPWEFMSEAILNFSKVLEALFPPHGDGRSIDAARSGLKQLGYTEEELERDFIPAIALRNGIDVYGGPHCQGQNPVRISKPLPPSHLAGRGLRPARDCSAPLLAYGNPALDGAAGDYRTRSTPPTLLPSQRPNHSP